MVLSIYFPCSERGNQHVGSPIKHFSLQENIKDIKTDHENKNTRLKNNKKVNDVTYIECVENLYTEMIGSEENSSSQDEYSDVVSIYNSIFLCSCGFFRIPKPSLIQP